MSLGNGNILVQRKDQNSGGTLTGADNGLNVSGTTVKAGGPLTQNTDIDTSNFLYYIGSLYNYLMINVDDDVFYFGKCNNDLSLRSGYYFDTDEAGLKYENQKGLKIYSDSVVPNGTIVSEIGDIDAGHNGTKIKITDSTETVEITNVPNVDTTNLAPLFLSGNRVVKGTNANVDWQAFTPTTYDEANINSPVFSSAKFCIINSTGFYEIEVAFKITDTMQNFFYMGVDISDIQTITGLTISAYKFFPNSAYATSITPRPITDHQGYDDGDTGFALDYWSNTQIGSHSGGYNFLKINGMFKITNV